ncbi:hypothetical protein HGA91_05520 [candidate division WWE3 bacterium]|nr:hypothetical protein [candidate division WWE3 bacterium]
MNVQDEPIYRSSDNLLFDLTITNGLVKVGDDSPQLVPPGRRLIIPNGAMVFIDPVKFEVTPFGKGQFSLTPVEDSE